MDILVKAEKVTRSLFEACFIRHDLQHAVSLFAEDILLVSANQMQCTSGITSVEAYLERKLNMFSEPLRYDCSLLTCQKISRDECSLTYRLSLHLPDSFRTYCVNFLVTEHGNENLLIRSIHYFESPACSSGQDPLPNSVYSQESVRQRLQFLNDSLPGGMIGGYIEDGFPLYFVNSRLLEYLGYASELEFLTRIDNKLINLVYEKDREMIIQLTTDSLQKDDQFVAEFRLIKRDGSSFWVHAVTRRIQAKNGRLAFMTVCIDITPQHKAQQALVHLYNSVPGAVLRCDLTSGLPITDSNNGLFEMTGYTRREFALIDNKLSALLPKEDYSLLVFRIKESMRSGEVFAENLRIICKNGELKWVSCKAQSVLESDRPSSLYCVLVDTTEEKQLEQRIKELYKQELSYFAEASATEGVIQGRLNATANRLENYLTVSGVSIGEVGDSYDNAIESLAATAFDPSYGDFIRQTLKREKLLADYAAGHSDYNFEFLRYFKDRKSMFWCSTSFRSLLNPETGEIIVFFYSNDITEQKMNNLLMNKLVTLDYDAIVEIDIPQDSYRSVSFNAARMDTIPHTGRFQQEIRAASERCMESPFRQEYLEKLSYAYMRKTLAVQDSYTFSVELRDEQGHRRIKRFQVFYLDQNLQRVCYARSDVTGIVTAEQNQKNELAAALVAARKASEAKTSFLSRISHELRTPMNAIIGMGAIAMENLEDQDRLKDSLEKIDLSAHYLLALFNDILDMNRIESGRFVLHPEKTRMRKTIDSVLTICMIQAQSKGVAFYTDLSAVINKYYVCDGLRLQQVLVNIISNAIKFTDSGGEVRFSAQCSPLPEADRLEFIISDNGIGISPSFLPHLFEPFTQEACETNTPYEGTGLGLSICKKIIDLMHGSISVQSQLGKGSCFKVSVELERVYCQEANNARAAEATQIAAHSPRKPSAPSKNEVHEPIKSPKRRILIAEDNHINAEITRRLLEHKGFEVTTAQNGRQALELFSSSEIGTYSAILMDIRMPVLDGLSAAKEIRKQSRSDAQTIPIIAVSANSYKDDVSGSIASGMNAHIAKPINPAQLYTILNRLIDQ